MIDNLFGVLVIILSRNSAHDALSSEGEIKHAALVLRYKPACQNTNQILYTGLSAAQGLGQWIW